MFKFNNISISLAMIASLLLPISVQAKEKHVSYDLVPVISAYPITKIQKHSTPYKDCWTEQVRIEPRYSNHYSGSTYPDALFGPNSYTGPILGGLVGGGIGHALGHRKANKKAGAVLGGLLGGAVGYDLTRNRHPANDYYDSTPRYEHQQRCETRYETYEEEKIVGYNVQYRYNGHVYSTRTRNDPGDSLRLKITATPMED